MYPIVRRKRGVATIFDREVGRGIDGIGSFFGEEPKGGIILQLSPVGAWRTEPVRVGPFRTGPLR